MLAGTFENVYVINLDRRKERLESFFQKIPEDWPFRRPERYSAIDGDLATPPKWWKGNGGSWGCYRAHIRILEDCLSNDIDSVLILEDDAVCVDGFAEKVEKFWEHLPDDWEMVYLGGQHIQENHRLPRKVNDWVYRPYNVNRCHCYGFRGRKMIERAYRHLNDYVSWNVPHHVDHYLGELHKITESGLYVPKEWLVAQSEGQSNICNKDLEYRLFPGSEETMFPAIDLPCVVITGTYFGGINTLAGAMHKLGLYLGCNLGKPKEDNRPHYFEDLYLGEICRKMFEEPWLIERLPEIDRENHLRRWAGFQCKHKPDAAKILCGKHPLLSLLGPQLMTAWNSPKFICVERSDEDAYEAMKQVHWAWHPTAAKRSFEMLRQTRNEFFESRKPDLFRVDHLQMKSQPQNTLESLCEFMKHTPTEQQLRKACSVIENCSNDLCCLNNS